MGNEQSQANGRVVCQGAAFVSDGRSFRQVVDVQKNVTYTNHDASSLEAMMHRDVQSAVEQFETSIAVVDRLAQDAVLSGRNTVLK